MKTLWIAALLATFELYDLSRRALVISATFKGSTENEHPMIDPQIGATGVVGVRVPPEERGYPEVPNLARALEQPFRDFARILPGSARKPSTPPLEKK